MMNHNACEYSWLGFVQSPEEFISKVGGGDQAQTEPSGWV